MLNAVERNLVIMRDYTNITNMPLDFTKDSFMQIFVTDGDKRGTSINMVSQDSTELPTFDRIPSFKTKRTTSPGLGIWSDPDPVLGPGINR